MPPLWFLICQPPQTALLVTRSDVNWATPDGGFWGFQQVHSGTLVMTQLMAGRYSWSGKVYQASCSLSLEIKQWNNLLSHLVWYVWIVCWNTEVWLSQVSLKTSLLEKNELWYSVIFRTNELFPTHTLNRITERMQTFVHKAAIKKAMAFSRYRLLATKIWKPWGFPLVPSVRRGLPARG